MKRLICLFLMLFIFGCATTNFTPTGKSFAVYSGPVQLLDTAPGVYESVGWLNISSTGGIGLQSLIVEAKEKAALHGANAIIFNQSSVSYGSNSNMPIIMCQAIRI